MPNLYYTSPLTSYVQMPAVDALITGWHDPEASHLELIAAVAGPEIVERSYATAHALGYHGHEFGDFHLILPSSSA